MDMEELHESLEGTNNYYWGTSYCFGTTLSGFALGCSSNYIKTPFAPSHVINSILSKFALNFFL
jgi:hypothetical protein